MLSPDLPASESSEFRHQSDGNLDEWSLIIRPHNRLFDLHLADVWRFRDLLWMFVRRDFVAVYKQTILGPLWFFIQPLLTTLVFTIIFSGVAKMSTGGYPAMLFYLDNWMSADPNGPHLDQMRPMARRLLDRRQCALHPRDHCDRRRHLAYQGQGPRLPQAPR